MIYCPHSTGFYISLCVPLSYESFPAIYLQSTVIHTVQTGFRFPWGAKVTNLNTLWYDIDIQTYLFSTIFVFILIALYGKLAVTSAILFFGAVWFCFASSATATGSGFQRNLHQAPNTSKHQTHPSQKNWILGHCFSVVQCSFTVMWLETPPF